MPVLSMAIMVIHIFIISSCKTMGGIGKYSDNVQWCSSGIFVLSEVTLLTTERDHFTLVVDGIIVWLIFVILKYHQNWNVKKVLGLSVLFTNLNGVGVCAHI